MKRTLIVLVFALLGAQLLTAQEAAQLRAELSSDSVLLGNYFSVRFTLENASGKEFHAPEFEHFEVVSGPNLSSSISVINGKVSQSTAYTFYLQPREAGSFYIEPASIDADGQILETEPLEILVLPNPDGIIQQPKSLDNNMDRFLFQEGFNFGDLLRDMPQLRDAPTTPPATPPTPAPTSRKKRRTYKL